MQIIWKGQNCFQIITQKTKNGQTIVVIDPPEESSGLRLSPLEADILIFTGPHAQEKLKAIKDAQFLVDGPGEYEIKEIFIRGIAVPNNKSKTTVGETIFIVEGEGMRLCHLGNLKQKELTADQVDEIGDIDILMISVGGNYATNAEEARKIISQIEPKIVIPMNYQIPKLKIKTEGVDKFLKEMGIKTVEAVNKLSVKQKDLPTEETRVILLNP